MIDQATYDKLLAETWETIKELGKKKGGEYASDRDRLANFRRHAARLDLPMEIIWAIYAAKHFDALLQFCSDIRTNTIRPRMENLEGRCDDLIVYLILFKCMLQERGS